MMSGNGPKGGKPQIKQMFSGSRLRRHPSTIEGFRSIIQRRVVGTFHRVGKKHMMPLHVASSVPP
jgi:hypothetical protein